MTAAQATRRRPVTGRGEGAACLPQDGDDARDCELCRGAGLCPQCTGTGTGTGTGEAEAVGS